MKKLLSLLLTFPLCCMAFSSCNRQSTTDEPKTTEADALSIISGKKTDYVMILPEDPASAVRSAAIAFGERLTELTGAAPERKTDQESVTAYEIVIGSTNRPQSQKAAEFLGDADFLLAVIDGKLTVYGAAPNCYARALETLVKGYATEQGFSVPLDLCRTGSIYDSCVAEEKISGNTRIDISLRLNEGAKPGILIGEADESAKFGYSGYAVTLEINALTLWHTAGDSWSALAVKTLPGLETYAWYKIRVETTPDLIRMYYLDDMEGIQPWPEAEIPAVICDGFSVSYIEDSGKGADYRDFSVTAAEPTEKPAATYTNAIYDDYADPDVQYWDGKFFLYATSGPGYLVHSSTDLVHWKNEGICMEATAWGYDQNYWAPDVDYIDGKFYMVCSVSEHLGIASSDSPTGPFIPQETYLYDRSIDGHIFVDDDGRVYLYYVSWREGHTYGIWGCEMNRETMTPIQSTEKLMISHSEDWEEYNIEEKISGGVCEGPYMLKHNGLYYLTYSGSDYQSQHYAVGYATSSSPLGDFEKYPSNPIMVGNSFIAGTGHHCIVTLPDGEMYIVYHCHNSVSQIHVRKICIDQMRFAPTPDGVDRLEVYGPTTTPQPLPKADS